VTDSWQAQREALGAFIRAQRQHANLSLRQLADLTSLSNPYLSQIERGLHEPSVRVLKAISDALNLSAETLLAQAGLVDAVAGQSPAPADAAGEADPAADDERTEAAITANRRLSDDQKAALIAVYRSMVDRSGH
jgi:transcriptional regulator with XRE-family HTH domain